MPTITEMRMVPTHNLAGSGYAAGKGLDGTFLKPAVTVSASGITFPPETNPHSDTRPVSGSYIETPRRMDLDLDESTYRRSVLGFEGETTAIDDASKMALTERLVGTPVAQTGVAFAKEYQGFRATTFEAFLDRFAGDYNAEGVVVRFAVEGIVQKCGTRGTFQRLFDMVRLHPESRISIENMEDPNKVMVTTHGDLFSAFLFQGLISPKTTFVRELIEPKIFHVSDFGEFLAPHHLVVSALHHQPLSVPMGQRMYTINITRLSAVDIFDEGGPVVQLGTDTMMWAWQTLALAQKFMNSI